MKETYKRALQKSPTKEPYKRALQKRPTKETYKRALQKSPTKEPYKREVQQRPTIETLHKRPTDWRCRWFLMWLGLMLCKCLLIHTVRCDIVWCWSALSDVYPKEAFNKGPLTVGEGLFWRVEVPSCVSVCWYTHTLVWHRVVIEWAQQCVLKRDIQKRPTDCRCRSLLTCRGPFLSKFLLMYTLRFDGTSTRQKRPYMVSKETI